MAMTASELPDDPGRLRAMLVAERHENERLRQIIKELQRHRFGRRAEPLPEDQLLLGLEEAEQIEASGEEEKEQSSPDRRAKATKRRANRGALPAQPPPLQLRRPTRLGERIFVAGDHRDTASIQGALASGSRVAAAVERQLAGR